MKINKNNGYKTRETSYVLTWILDRHSDAKFWAETARSVYGRTEPPRGFTKEWWARYDLAYLLEEHYEGTLPDVTDTLAQDLLNFAFDAVEWPEIAEFLLLVPISESASP
jgi:hypothetical protein